MSYGLPAMTLLFTWWLPAAVQLSFWVSGVISFLQSLLFQSAAGRKVLGLDPLTTRVKGPEGPTSPYKGNMKIAATAQVQAARPRPALTTLEINSRFQAAEPPQPPVSGLRAKVNEKASALYEKMATPIGDVAASGRAMVEKANLSMDRRRAKGEMEERKRYEIKRAEELKKERLEMNVRKRAERAARKEASRSNEGPL